MRIKNLPRGIKYELYRREKILINLRRYLEIVDNEENKQLKNLLVNLDDDLKENIIKMQLLEGIITQSAIVSRCDLLKRVLEKLARDIRARQFFIRAPFLWNSYRTCLGTVRINKTRNVDIIATPRPGCAQNLRPKCVLDHYVWD